MKCPLCDAEVQVPADGLAADPEDMAEVRRAASVRLEAEEFHLLTHSLREWAGEVLRLRQQVAEAAPATMRLDAGATEVVAALVLQLGGTARVTPRELLGTGNTMLTQVDDAGGFVFIVDQRDSPSPAREPA